MTRPRAEIDTFTPVTSWYFRTACRGRANVSIILLILWEAIVAIPVHRLSLIVLRLAPPVPQ